MSSPSSEQPPPAATGAEPGPVPASARATRLAMCTLAARGLWREISRVLRHSGHQGHEAPTLAWARLAGCLPDEFLVVAKELLDNRIVGGRIEAERVSLWAPFVVREPRGSDVGGDDESRRMKNERQKRYRDRQTSRGEIASADAHGAPRDDHERVHLSATSGASGEATASRNGILFKSSESGNQDTPSGRQRPTAVRARDGPVWTGERWEGISPEIRAEWQAAFPACDIDRQLAAMKAWLVANASRAHKSNWPRFIVNWLKREQDRGGDERGSSGRGRPAHRVAHGAERVEDRREQRRAAEFAEPGLAARVVVGGTDLGPGRGKEEVEAHGS